MNKLISFVKELTKANVEELNSAERIGRKYFYITKELKELKDKIQLEPYSAGVFLGELKNNKFMPSIALLDILSKYSDRKVWINKKGETMFLYSKDVFAENIEKRTIDEGLCLVLNDKDELLGLGELGKGRNAIIRNLLDRGDFLRRERE